MSKDLEKRSVYAAADFKVRAEPDSGEKYIEGYFAVFNQRTELWPGFYEEIAPGAFDGSLKNNDIRCLFNHNSDIVLGRTVAGTLILKEDAHGLWGSVRINQDDKQALDIYARVARGDISGCSFGFYPIKEEYTELESGDVLCRVIEVDLSEVSICTFPAYPQTEVQAREKAYAAMMAQRREKLKENIKRRLERLKCLNSSK